MKAILRYWAILQLIPRTRWVTVPTLVEALKARGIRGSERSLQRDVVSLSALFPLECDRDHGKPYGWRWHKDAPTMQLPGMDAATALALHLTASHLSTVLPAGVRESLQQSFDLARNVLDALSTPAAGSFAKRVRWIAAGPPLQPPSILPEVVTVLTEAVFSGRCVEAMYRKPGSRNPEPYLLHPLGMVAKGPVLYLVAHKGSPQEPRQFLFHRFASAALAVDAGGEPLFGEPGDFDLDAHIASGAMGFTLPTGMLELVLRAERGLAGRLTETRLSSAQGSRELPDGRVEITAAAADSHELRNWLLGFGADLEVVSPPMLRAHFAETTRRLAERYARPAE